MNSEFPVVLPWTSVGHPWDFGWTSVGLPSSHGTYVGLPWCSHGNSIGLPRASMRLPWDFGLPWDSCGSSESKIVFPWDPHGLPCHSHGTAMGILWDCIVPMIVLWDLHGIPMELPLNLRGISTDHGLPWELRRTPWDRSASMGLSWDFRGTFMALPWDFHEVPQSTRKIQ